MSRRQLQITPGTIIMLLRMLEKFMEETPQEYWFGRRELVVSGLAANVL